VPRKGYGWLAIVAGIALFSPSQQAFPAEVIKRLSLEESVQLALARSLSLHAAKEGILEAEARKNEAGGAFFPQINTSYSFTRLNTPPSFNFPGLPPLVPPSTMITGTEENYNWALELKQPLFAGGAIRAGYEIGLIGADMARSNIRTVQADIIREVKVAYFRILKAARIVNVARQSVTGLQTHRDQAQMFYNHGLIPRNDLLTAEVELTNGKQLLLRAQNSVELAKAGMNTLLRREINAPVELEDIPDYRPIDKTWEDCVKTALDNRPEIKSHTLQNRLAQEIVRQAKSAYLPTINFLGNYSRYGDEPGLAGSAYKSQENWYATLVANWNIWEGGRSKSRLDAGLSKEKQAMDAYLSVQDRIVLELKEAYLHLRETEQQIPAAMQAVAQAEENLRITKERYREQVARAADVIDAQTILTRAQTDYENARGDYHISLAGLERAMGTGSAPYPLP
jgi:outer membrane protein